MRHGKYLVVDDVISTGDTVRHIVSSIDGDSVARGTPAGIVLYASFRQTPLAIAPHGEVPVFSFLNTA